MINRSGLAAAGRFVEDGGYFAYAIRSIVGNDTPTWGIWPKLQQAPGPLPAGKGQTSGSLLSLEQTRTALKKTETTSRTQGSRARDWTFRAGTSRCWRRRKSREAAERTLDAELHGSPGHVHQFQ